MDIPADDADSGCYAGYFQRARLAAEGKHAYLLRCLSYSHSANLVD